MMKPISSLICCAACAMGCADEGTATDELAAASLEARRAEVPRNGVDDTAALAAALRSCVPGGPACVVQLGAGTYRSGQILIENFHGWVRGRGMGRTIIEALPGFVVTQDNGPLGAFTHDPSPTNPYPAILTLWPGADARFSDLTLRVTEFDPTTGWYYGQDNFVTWLKAAIMVSGSARFERVEFQGSPGTDAGFDLDNGPMVISASDVSVDIARCRVHATGNGFEVALLHRARITVGGEEEAGNSFDQGSGGGLFYGLDASAVEYAHNRSDTMEQDWFGLVFFNDTDFELTAPTRARVHHNRIATSGPTVAGIWVVDVPSFLGTPSLDLTIVENRIRVANDPPGVGMLVPAMTGGVIARNELSGSGDAAIRVGNVGGCRIARNDMDDFVAAVAPIWLRPASHDCTVVVDDAADVLDEGTANTILVER